MFVCVTSKFGYAGYFRGRYVSKLYQSLDEQSFSIFIDFKLLVYYIAVYYKVTPESEWVVFCFPIYSISQRTEMQVSTWLFSCLVQTVLKVYCQMSLCWDIIKEWLSLPISELLAVASCRKHWKRISAEFFLMYPLMTQSVKELNWTESKLASELSQS